MIVLKEDLYHSNLGFKIKHLMISNVIGKFSRFDATIMSDGDLSKSSVHCEIDVASIDTGIKDRDDHLKSQDFFDAEKYPKMFFRSEKIHRVSKDDIFKMYGILKIKNEERKIELDVVFNGKDEDENGIVKYGYDIDGKIKRSDWDLKFNISGGQNTLLIGDDVKIDISIQMIQVSDG